MQKGVALLSGGFDSPVAIHLMKDRLDIIAAHFHQEELTGPQELEKVKELVRVLDIKKAYFVPFTNVLKVLASDCDHKQYFIISKIAMFMAAQMIAKQEGAEYLVTGENLAQVSSQTLSNISTITKAISFEILRPVLTYDKQEIINVAKVIKTYDTSKGPEICSLLGPKNPATKSKYEDIQKELEKIDLNGLLVGALEEATVIEN